MPELRVPPQGGRPLAVETSVYVAPDAGGRSVGRALYDALYDALFGAIAHEGLSRCLVGIALPNDASVRLRERLGFARVGVFDGYAHKHGRPIGSLWMQRGLD